MLFQQKAIFTELVQEISRTIGENVIFTDEAGVIQASTEHGRIGNFHEGAKLAMKRREYMHMTTKRTKQLEGVRKGVVTPIVIEGNPIGVVGITGEPKQIEPFILVVQRLAELFIKSSVDQMAQEKYARNRELFVFDWLSGSLKLAELHEYSDFYGLEVAFYEQAILIHSSTFSTFTADDVARIQEMWDRNGQAIVVRWGQGKLLVLDRSRPKEQLDVKLQQFTEVVHRRLDNPILIGVGQQSHYLELNKSLQQAEIALQLTTSESPLIYEEDLVFEYIQHHLDDQVKTIFLKRTIAPIIDDADLVMTLETWFANRMKIDQTSQALHIHKNTLYYRLDKIKKLTKLNTDNMHDIVLLYMAIQFHQEKK